MKIIDILNKINNGEEVPKKIKFNKDVFTYNTERKEYEHTVGKYIKETLLFKAMNTHFIKELLRAEIKPIEENKEIEELWANTIGSSKQCRDDFALKNRRKINELVRAVNKLIKESEEK